MNFDWKGKIVFFATSNIHKFNEARVVLANHNLASGMIRAKTLEVQSDSLDEIASKSVADAVKFWHLPFIVEDAGLFVDALKGFPGPYSAYVYKTIDNKGLLKLMENVQNRKATFRSAIAYFDQELNHVVCFSGETTGEITKEERITDRKSAFGFDPIFQPYSSKKTFAEMTIKEKNNFSHRAQAVNKFAKWYKEYGMTKK